MVITVDKECKHHGIQKHRNYAGDGRYRCLVCESERKKKHRRKVKAILVAEHGGKCLLCGYDKYIGALEFHHLDRSTKSFTIASMGWMKGLERLRKEAAKCILLCSNCHREAENDPSILESRLMVGSLTLTQKV
jgi:5-methylcytosine-specific restriction endonuclease McrA